VASPSILLGDPEPEQPDGEQPEDEEPEAEPEPEQPTGDGDPEDFEDVSEWPFEVELLDLADLIVDHTYQRPVEERFVRIMAQDFDETLVGCIDVSEREGGVYAILDGQQRFEVMKLNGKTTCFASVFTDMTLQDEAGFFFRKNKDRRAMKGYFGFRARVIAGDPAANEVEEVVRTAGFALGPVTDHTDVIGAVIACEKAMILNSPVRRDCLSPALRLIGAAWRGRDYSLNGTVIVGLAQFWKAFADEEVEWERLLGVLQGEIAGPRNMVSLGRERQGTEGLPVSVARVVAWGYNRALEDDQEPLDLERIKTR
jgi:hypothetical protein